MDNAGGPSRADQLDLMLTYEQHAHARTKAERDAARAEVRIGRAAKLIRNVGIEHVVRSIESQSALCRRAAGEIDAALIELRAEVTPLEERAS